MGYSPWNLKESNMTEQLTHTHLPFERDKSSNLNSYPKHEPITVGQGNSYQSTRLDGWLIASSPRYRSGLRSKAGASQPGHLESPEAVVCRKQTVAPKGQLCESSQLCFLDITLAV